MKRFVSRLFLPLLVLSMAISACNQAPAPDVAQTGAGTEAVPVEVTQVGTGNIASTLSYTGDLQPVQSLQLVSLVSGAIEEVLVEVGDEVRTGDPILRVVDTTFRAQLNQAESGLAIAQLNKVRMDNGPRDEQVIMAEAGLAVAEANLRKLEKGPRDEQIALAEAAVDGAQAQLNSVLTVTEDERILAAANLAQAEAQLRLAQAEYDKIKWAGQVAETPQAIQLEQATIAYETALAAYNRQVSPDETDLEGFRTGIRQAQLSLSLARNPFVEEDFVLAQAGVDQAKAQLDMAADPFTAEDIAQAAAGVQQAEAAVALAQFQVDNAILRAPFDGIVSEVYVTTGSVASPQSPAISLISNDLEVVIQVPENQIANIQKGQPASIKVAAYSGQDFPALVTTIAPAADSTSRTFPVTIVPASGQGQLLAGMFAESALLLEERVGAILVPRSAIASLDGQEAVYVLAEDGQTVNLRPVTLGLSDADRIEIIEGLVPDETIVTAGLNNLVDGSSVEVVVRAE